MGGAGRPGGPECRASRPHPACPARALAIGWTSTGQRTGTAMMRIVRMSVLDGLISSLASSTAAFAAAAPETPDEAPNADSQPPPPTIQQHTATAGGARLAYIALSVSLTTLTHAGTAHAR